MKLITLTAPLALLTTLFLLLPDSPAQTRTTRKARSTAPAPPDSSTRNLPSAITTLPLRRVIVYSNGVAYFERRGNVTGSAEVNLSFKQSQVDDVLKSLVVLDLGKGRIGSVSYNSSAPPEARLNEIPFAIDAATSGDDWGGIAGVLKQLQGARVLVTAATRTGTGVVLTVEERKAQPGADKPPAINQRLVIATEGGELQSFDLSEVRSVKLLDEGTKHDLSEFASASASARRRDAKTITVTSEGEGSREMVISYTIAAPIWKTTYRVVLDAAGKPFFQGWAIVDNVSEEDWTNVQLSLVSGTPMSFIQPMQQPLYRYRTVLPIPDDLKLSPQPYEFGAAAGHGGNFGGETVSTGGGRASGSAGGFGAGSAIVQSQQVQSLPLNGRNFMENATGFSRPTTTVSDAITSGESGVEAAATGNEVGELFEYRIEQPVTVRRDRSALIPILQQKLEGERVALYNEATRKARPMSSIRLKNISALTLEGGAVTVLDGDAYAGESLLERLKPNEQRFVTFAVDLGTLITTKFKSDRRPVFLVRAAKGVFEAHYYKTEKKTYTIINQTDKKRTVYVEHPIHDGWSLSDDTQKPVSKSTNHYRFRVELEPRATIELPILETQALMDSYQLAGLTSRDVELFVSSNYLDAPTKAELDKLIELKGRVTEVEIRIKRLEEEEEAITEDQKRLRENIAALKNTTEARQLIARYIAKADQQETRLEQITAEKKASGAELTKRMIELEAAIRAFTLDRKL